jgi:hypothetical protein
MLSSDVDRRAESWHTLAVDFKVIGRIGEVETIAAGHGIRELRRLNRVSGRAYWRKLKGCAV